MSSERRTGHERFRNLFKSGSKEHVGAATQPSRIRVSTNSPSPFKNAKPAGSKESVGKSSKSVKRHKASAKKQTVNRKKKSSTTTPTPHKSPESSNNSNRRASKSPHLAARTPTTPTTPPINVGSRARTPGKKASNGPPKKFNGQDVQEMTQMCNTVFENDVGGGMPSSGGVETIQLAQARIKERKLQWKKEEPKTDPRQQEATRSSHEGSLGMEDDKKGSKEETRPEANVTVRDHTIFENDENPAPVKEAERKLQWAPGAAEQCMSEPAVRKKKSDEKQRGVMSDRPPREHTPIKPLRGVPALSMRTPALRTPVKTAASHSPVAETPAVTPTVAHSPSTRPLILDVAANFGQISGSPQKEDPKQNVSCYLAPNMQQQQEYNITSKKSGSGPDSEPYIN